MVNNKWVRTWNEGLVAYLNKLSLHSDGESEENHEMLVRITCFQAEIKSWFAY